MSSAENEILVEFDSYFIWKGSTAPILRDAIESVLRQNRGRRAKSECKNLHYQKTKIQVVSRSST
ncbi:MAG: hypothetical protein ACFFDF_06915 [Candidatus Odinarchaeota archaeon]